MSKAIIMRRNHYSFKRYRAATAFLLAAIGVYFFLAKTHLGPWRLDSGSEAITGQVQQIMFDSRPDDMPPVSSLTEASRLLQPPLWTDLIKDSLAVYSAHWDVRPLHGMEPPFVRILAYTVNGSRIAEHLATKFQCQFFFGDASTKVVPGMIIRHQKADHSDNAFFILCPAAQTFVLGDQIDLESDVPLSVALSCEGCYSAASYEIYGRRVLEPFAGRTFHRQKLAVCVRPAFGLASDALQLVQFLVYYSLLGAKHFTFYNAPGMAPNLVKVLQAARKQGLSIDVLPWNGQDKNTKANKMHEHNQYMAINACLYWHMPYFEHSAIVDLDEYISYRHGIVKDLPDLLDELRMNNPNAAAFLFRHYLFTNMNKDSGGLIQQKGTGTPLDIFRLTERHGPLDAHARSKLICVSDNTVTAAVHALGERSEGHSEVIVPVEDAALFHFRKKVVFRILENSTIDLEMAKYMNGFYQHPLISSLLKAASML